MKQFNLEKALSGEPVITRSGHKITQIHYEKLCTDDFPVCAYIECEGWETFKEDGHVYECDEHRLDLFMAPIKKEGWINLYRDDKDRNNYLDKNLAKNGSGTANNYVDTVKIEWEE